MSCQCIECVGYRPEPTDREIIAALEAENAKLRKDAERYRWLRDQNETLDQETWVVTSKDYTDAEGPERYWVGADLDAAIDAAKEAQS